MYNCSFYKIRRLQNNRNIYLGNEISFLLLEK